MPQVLPGVVVAARQVGLGLNRLTKRRQQRAEQRPVRFRQARCGEHVVGLRQLAGEARLREAQRQGAPKALPNRPVRIGPGHQAQRGEGLPAVAFIAGKQVRKGVVAAVAHHRGVE